MADSGDPKGLTKSQENHTEPSSGSQTIREQHKEAEVGQGDVNIDSSKASTALGDSSGDGVKSDGKDAAVPNKESEGMVDTERKLTDTVSENHELRMETGNNICDPHAQDNTTSTPKETSPDPSKIDSNKDSNNVCVIDIDTASPDNNAKSKTDHSLDLKASNDISSNHCSMGGMTEDVTPSTNDSAIASDLSQISELTYPSDSLSSADPNNSIKEDGSLPKPLQRQDSGINTNDSLAANAADEGDVNRKDCDNDIAKSEEHNCDNEDDVVDINPETDGVMPASIDTEDSEPTGQYEVTAEEEARDRSSTDDANINDVEAPPGISDESDVDMEGVEAESAVHSRIPRLRALRRRRRRNVAMLSSSSSSENNDEEVPELAAESGSEEEDETPYVENDYKPPPDTWHPHIELKHRELGYGNRCYGTQLFSYKAMGSVELVRRLKLQTKLESHGGCVNALNFSADGKFLASGSDDLEIVVWDWAHQNVAMKFDSGHRANVFQAKFMPYSGNCTMISCARDGQVRLAELSTTGVCKGTKKLAQHRGSAHKLSVLEDSPHIFLSCGEDAVTYQLDLRQDKPSKLCTTKENGKKIALYSIHSHPHKSEEYCVGGRDHFVRIYDRRMVHQEDDDAACNLVKKFCPHNLIDNDQIKANVTCAVYSYDGGEILATYNDEDIYLFDSSHSDGADSTHRYSGHRNNATVKGVNFYGPKSEFIVSGSDCSNIFLWEKESEKVVSYFHGDDGGVVNVLEPHPNIPVLATSGLDNDVKIWAPTAEEPVNLKGLMKVMKKNQKERDAERRAGENEMFDSQMLWMLLYHSRRAARRQARDEGESSQSSPSSNSDSDDSDPPAPMQCLQS